MTLGLKFERTGLSPRGVAHVQVMSHWAERAGEVLISPDAASYTELENYVRDLKLDLDRVLATARKEFSAAENAPEIPLGID